MTEIIINALVGFVVGILSGLATHYLLKSKIPKGELKWNEAFVWSFLPIAFAVLSLAFIQYRWPISLSAKITLLVGNLLISVGLLVATKRFSNYLNLPATQEMATLIIIGSFVTLSYFYILDQSLPHDVALDCPNQVGTSATLQGRVTNPAWRVYVLLRPRTSNGAYIFRALPPGEDGVWKANCSFGGTTGDQFDVYAVALPPDLAHSIDSGGPLPDPRVVDNAAPNRTSICSVTIFEPNSITDLR